MLKSTTLSFLFLALVSLGCVPSDDLSDVELANDTRSIAFPIINTSINVTDFERESDSGNVSVSTDEEGRVTVKYDGQVVSRDWSVISPPLPVAAFPFQDSVSNVVVPRPGGGTLINDEFINYIEFAEWNIRYQIKHSYTEAITVTFTIPQIKNQGVPYRQTLTIPYDGTPVEAFITNEFPLEGYVFQTTENEFIIKYDARLSNGERVEFDESAGIFQPFNASYIEGYLGQGTFPVRGNIVPVNLFSAWKSGGAVFENPSIDMYVENSLGLPMSAEFNEFSITTLADDTIPVMSDVLDAGIEINFPSLAEKGEAKTTNFSFDKNNSNLKELFQERVKRVNYEIVAIYNKDSVRMDDQFIGDGGYFSANVSVTIPLEGNITELVLNDTVDVDLTDYDRIDEGEIKTVITNEFPLDLDYQAYFIDEAGIVLDSLFNERFSLAGAPLNAQGITESADTQTALTNISAERWEVIRNSTRIAFDFMLNTNSINNSPLWVYDQYDIIVKIGAILEVNTKEQ